MPYIPMEVSGRYIGKFPVPAELVGDSGKAYSIEHHEDGGGNGAVFQARSNSVANRVAIKFQRKLDDVRLSRFENEIRIQRDLHHRCIAQLIDSGVSRIGDYDVPWSAMEWGNGNLRDHVDRLGRLEAALFVDVACDICAALEHLHSMKIIHRDIKPANFVWSMDGHGVLMIDFGIAKYVGENLDGRYFDDLTRENDAVGAKHFFSPELIAYASDKTTRVDYRSDIFQLGRVLWFLATGQVSAGVPSKKLCPFGGRLHAVVQECLQDDPEDRPQSARRLKALIEGLREGSAKH